MIRPQQPTRSLFWLLIPLAFVIRLVYASMRELVPDEAFYWVLSRHLSTGYLDHPPMVAYVIKLGTALFGSNEVGVRSGAAVLAFGALLILLYLCRRIIDGERATILLGVTWLCSPLFAGIATIMTPDTPAIFFSTAAMACAFLAIDRTNSDNASADFHSPSDRPQLWFFFGMFTGLAMMSKYTAVLPAGAVLMALLTSRQGRQEFRKPGIWLAGVVALIVFFPVIHWNQTHAWASFKFQLHHGMDDTDLLDSTPSSQAVRHLVSLGKYLVGQIGFFTPVFFVFGIVIVAIRWWHYRELSPAFRILVWSATIPLLFFGFAAVKSGNPGEGNWPAFGYFPMSLLTIEHIARRWKPFDVKTLKIGCGVALLITVVLHMPDQLYKLTKDRIPYPKKMNDFYGWRDMARIVERARFRAPVVAGRHQDAAELSFYLPGQPEVWVYPLRDLSGQLDNRPTAYDYFPDRPDISKSDHVFFFQGHTEDFCRMYGFATTRTEKIVEGLTIPLHGRLRQRRYDLVVRE